MLRIATVSDLHTDFAENRELVVRLAAEIHTRGADVVVVNGDISHEDERIERALLAFGAVAPRVAYVPGNHDLWSRVPGLEERTDLNSWDRYRVRLRDIAVAAGAHYLPAEPLVIDGVGLVGSAGWYDYSFAEPWVTTEVGLPALRSKRHGAFQWSDAALVAFRHADGARMDDAEVAASIEAELASALARLEADPSVRAVVACTHHQPYREVVYRTGTLPWEFLCAFMGSEGLGRAISAHGKVRVAVYGHSHIVGDTEIDGRRVYGTALGYPRERRGLSVEDVVRTRIGWIEL